MFASNKTTLNESAKLAAKMRLVDQIPVKEVAESLGVSRQYVNKVTEKVSAVSVEQTNGEGVVVVTNLTLPLNLAVMLQKCLKAGNKLDQKSLSVFLETYKP